METVWVMLPPPPVAVNVYVLVAPGVTFVLPGVQETVPTPLSMLHALAFAIPLHASVTQSREPIVAGVPVNDAMTGGAGGAAPTVTVAVRVALPVKPFAMSVYVVVAAGVTVLLPSVHETVPTLLSILHIVAFVIPLQESVVGWPAVTDAGLAPNVAIAGVPVTATVAAFVTLPPAPVAVRV
jgi:hypothetical protein